MSAPRVSVIIPAYNREATIARAIRSVQAQSITEWELIAVDDCSTDRTCDTVTAIRDGRIRLLRQTQNGGPSVARQRGVEASTGEYLAFLDSDDEWLPEKLEVQLDTGSRVVSCAYFVRDRDREWTFVHPQVTNWVEHLHFRCMLRAGSTLLVERSLVNAIGGFDPMLRYYEDWDLSLRLAEKAPIQVVSKPLVRIHVGGIRSIVAAEHSIRHFVKKHDAAICRLGAAHRRQVHSQHLQNLAVGAFAQRLFTRGSKWLLESFAANPLQNPARIGALILAPIDALFGTSLIARAIALQRPNIGEGNGPPAP